MSVTTKKKHVIDEVLNNYEGPSDGQTIVKVLSGRGNNLHEVITPEGDSFLASMPPKFRKNIWIKRGDFVVVEPITEGLKVKAEIVQILLKDQIKYFKSIGIWPKEFDEYPSNSKSRGDGDEDEEDCDDNLFVNDNRHNVDIQMSSSEESSDERLSDDSGDDEKSDDSETNSRDNIM